MMEALVAASGACAACCENLGVDSSSYIGVADTVCGLCVGSLSWEVGDSLGLQLLELVERRGLEGVASCKVSITLPPTVLFRDLVLQKLLRAETAIKVDQGSQNPAQSSGSCCRVRDLARELVKQGLRRTWPLVVFEEAGADLVCVDLLLEEREEKKESPNDLDEQRIFARMCKHNRSPSHIPTVAAMGEFFDRPPEEVLAELSIICGEKLSEKASSAMSTPWICFLRPTRNILTFSPTLCRIRRNSFFVSGRYCKFSRKISQSKWRFDDEESKQKVETSVEEIVGLPLANMCGAESFKLHAAGREDLDVLMLGNGRPFAIELDNPRTCREAFKATLADRLPLELEETIAVTDLHLDSRRILSTLARERQKVYSCVLVSDRPFDERDVAVIASTAPLRISQRTPLRVLHRRSALCRQRTIHEMRLSLVQGSSPSYILELRTESGTYIKEFVHGDLGRTDPSLGFLLNANIDITQLDVLNILD